MGAIAGLAVIIAFVIMIVQTGVQAGSEGKDRDVGIALGIGVVLTMLALLPGLVMLVFGLFAFLKGQSLAFAFGPGFKTTVIGAAIGMVTVVVPIWLEDRMERHVLYRLLFALVVFSEFGLVVFGLKNFFAVMNWIFGQGA